MESTENMQDMLAEVLAWLPGMLKCGPQFWKGLMIDNEYPHAEVLWRPFTGRPSPDGLGFDHRVSLRKLLPLPASAQPLKHSHPWPSAVKILRGSWSKAHSLVTEIADGWLKDKYPEWRDPSAYWDE